MLRSSSLDHIALWVDDRARLEAVIASVCGMHEIERTDTFTLLGGDARRGKITLFDAEGPREAGILQRVVVRVVDIEASLATLDDLGVEVEHAEDEVRFRAPSGVPLAIVHGGPGSPDLDAVDLAVPNPQATGHALARLGLLGTPPELFLGGRSVRLREGGAVADGKPLLNHLALLVESAAEARQEAETAGLEVDRVVDAPNTVAVFVRGPDGIVIEYVEHKPSFSLV